MNIAYLCTDFGIPLDGTKGAAVHVRAMVEAFSALGHSVTVISPSAGEIDLAGVEVRSVPVSSHLEAIVDALKREPEIQGKHAVREWRQLCYASYLASQVVPLLSGREWGLLYERYTLFGWAGSLLRSALGCPWVLEVNAPLREEQSRYRELSLPAVAQTIEELVFGGTGAIVAVSDEVRAYCIQGGADPACVEVMPNGVDPVRFSPDVRSDGIRERLGILIDAPLVGFAGSFKPWHGVATLLEGLTQPALAGLGCHALLLGDGPEQQGLKVRADELGVAERAHWVGTVPNSDVPAYLAACDVLVAPYDADSPTYFSPLKLFEYLAMGIPTVAAGTGQTAHIIKDGYNGLLYPPGDSTALARAVGTAILDRNLAALLGEAGRETVLSSYTWAGNARRVLELPGDYKYHNRRSSYRNTHIRSEVEANAT